MMVRKMVATGLLATATVLGTGTLALHAIPRMIALADDAAAAKINTVIASNGGTTLELATADTLPGNYIYVSYYTDEACKRLKSTTVYSTADLGSSRSISLGALNLKKGGFFKVYSEVVSEDKVNVYTIAGAAGKVKVKVENLAKEDFFEAVKIDIGGTTLTPENYKEHVIWIDGLQVDDPTDADVVKAAFNDFWKQCKIDARLGGSTIDVFYGGKYDSDGNAPNGLASQAKFKIKAAPKAPKVVVDYVNGAYTISKANYVVTTVDADSGVAGTITVKDDGTIENLHTVAKKESLSIDDILKDAGAGEGATSAALVVWSEKDKSMKSVEAVYLVKGLNSLDISAAVNNKITVKLTDNDGTPTDTLATVELGEKGITIAASKDMAYYDSSNSRWVTLKSGKSTKEIALAVSTSDAEDPATIKIKALGTKASKTQAGVWGSAEAEIQNLYVNPEIDKDYTAVDSYDRNITQYFQKNANGTYTEVTGVTSSNFTAKKNATPDGKLYKKNA